MNQNTCRMARYNEVRKYIEREHRNPSKYAPVEKLMVHFLKRCRKLMYIGELQKPHLGMFKEFFELIKENKRINQYQ